MERIKILFVFIAYLIFPGLFFLKRSKPIIAFILTFLLIFFIFAFQGNIDIGNHIGAFTSIIFFVNVQLMKEKYIINIGKENESLIKINEFKNTSYNWEFFYYFFHILFIFIIITNLIIAIVGIRKL